MRPINPAPFEERVVKERLRRSWLRYSAYTSSVATRQMGISVASGLDVRGDEEIHVKSTQDLAHNLRSLQLIRAISKCSPSQLSMIDRLPGQNFEWDEKSQRPSQSFEERFQKVEVNVMECVLDIMQNLGSGASAHLLLAEIVCSLLSDLFAKGSHAMCVQTLASFGEGLSDMLLALLTMSMSLKLSSGVNVLASLESTVALSQRLHMLTRESTHIPTSIDEIDCDELFIALYRKPTSPATWSNFVSAFPLECGGRWVALYNRLANSHPDWQMDRRLMRMIRCSCSLISQKYDLTADFKHQVYVALKGMNFLPFNVDLVAFSPLLSTQPHWTVSSVPALVVDDGAAELGLIKTRPVGNGGGGVAKGVAKMYQCPIVNCHDHFIAIPDLCRHVSRGHMLPCVSRDKIFPSRPEPTSSVYNQLATGASAQQAGPQGVSHRPMENNNPAVESRMATSQSNQTRLALSQQAEQQMRSRMASASVAGSNANAQPVRHHRSTFGPSHPQFHTTIKIFSENMKRVRAQQQQELLRSQSQQRALTNHSRVGIPHSNEAPPIQLIQHLNAVHMANIRQQQPSEPIREIVEISDDENDESPPIRDLPSEKERQVVNTQQADEGVIRISKSDTANASLLGKATVEDGRVETQRTDGLPPKQHDTVEPLNAQDVPEHSLSISDLNEKASALQKDKDKTESVPEISAQFGHVRQASSNTIAGPQFPHAPAAEQSKDKGEVTDLSVVDEGTTNKSEAVKQSQVDEVTLSEHVAKSGTSSSLSDQVQVYEQAQQKKGVDKQPEAAKSTSGRQDLGPKISLWSMNPKLKSPASKPDLHSASPPKQSESPLVVEKTSARKAFVLSSPKSGPTGASSKAVEGPQITHIPVSKQFKDLSAVDESTTNKSEAVKQSHVDEVTLSERAAKSGTSSSLVDQVQVYEQSQQKKGVEKQPDVAKSTSGRQDLGPKISLWSMNPKLKSPASKPDLQSAPPPKQSESPLVVEKISAKKAFVLSSPKSDPTEALQSRGEVESVAATLPRTSEQVPSDFHERGQVAPDEPSDDQIPMEIDLDEDDQLYLEPLSEREQSSVVPGSPGSKSANSDQNSQSESVGSIASALFSAASDSEPEYEPDAKSETHSNKSRESESESNNTSSPIKRLNSTSSRRMTQTGHSNIHDEPVTSLSVKPRIPSTDPGLTEPTSHSPSHLPNRPTRLVGLPEISTPKRVFSKVSPDLPVSQLAPLPLVSKLPSRPLSINFKGTDHSSHSLSKDHNQSVRPPLATALPAVSKPLSHIQEISEPNGENETPKRTAPVSADVPSSLKRHLSNAVLPTAKRQEIDSDDTPSRIAAKGHNLEPSIEREVDVLKGIEKDEMMRILIERVLALSESSLVPSEVKRAYVCKFIITNDTSTSLYWQLVQVIREILTTEEDKRFFSAVSKLGRHLATKKVVEQYGRDAFKLSDSLDAAAKHIVYKALVAVIWWRHLNKQK